MIKVLVEYDELSMETFNRLRKSLPLVVANYLQGAFGEKESDSVEVKFLSKHWADVTKFNFTISVFAPTVLTGDPGTDTDVLSECAKKIAKAIHEDSPGGERNFSVRIYPFTSMGYFAV
jgi:hypothetical protein